jgi:hypothetical protein
MRIISQSAQFLPQLFILPADICACERESGWCSLLCVCVRTPDRLIPLIQAIKLTAPVMVPAKKKKKQQQASKHTACACSFAIMIMYEPGITPLLSATIFAASVALMQKASQYPFRDAARLQSVKNTRKILMWRQRSRVTLVINFK